MREKLSGEIRADCAYTIREFCARTGMGYQRVHKYTHENHHTQALNTPAYPFAPHAAWPQ